jgi:hypothetical protein
MKNIIELITPYTTELLTIAAGLVARFLEKKKLRTNYQKVIKTLNEQLFNEIKRSK